MVPPQKTALIIDDDAALVEAMGEVLEEHGFAVEPFTSARRALERLRKGPPPYVVLVDYVMPDLVCAQFLRELADAGVAAPVLVVTGANPASVDANVRQAAAILSKPFSIEQLLQRIEKLHEPPRV
jgi:DNA-binding NtrC family response regulator